MSDREIMIRQAIEGDVPALIELLRRSWLRTWAPEVPFAAVQAFAAADPARHHAETQWASFLVAVKGDALLGMIQFAGDGIEHLHVDPRAWDLGIGSRLMDVAERLIGEAHASARLEVRAFNARALAFYGRRGWTEERRYPGLECDSPVENVEMRKALRPAVPS